MSEKQRYKIVERLAAGGMAEVYVGESAGIEGFRKKVAIKRVLPKLSANTEFINMFLDEARLCAYLTHSKCVQVFDIGESAGSHFIVMEFVDGADLKEVLDQLGQQRQVLPIGTACFIALQVCEGLAYAHGAIDHTGAPLCIVHRDISPHNVLMTRFGEVKLVDFGLAKASSHLTKEDEDIVKGKFGYLAPEVTLGQGADHRVDIFAAGILLWEMLAGRRLFRGETDVETFKQVQAAHVPDIRQIRGDVNDDIAYVLAKALARDREQRYQAANEMARDLGVTLSRLGQPVTYLDVAGFVQSAADERNRRKRGSRKKADEIIGDIILDTLHEFSDDLDALTSDEETSRLGSAGVDVSGGDFVDPSSWGLDDEFGDLFDQPKSTEIEEVEEVQEVEAPAAARPPPPPRRSAAERARAARKDEAGGGEEARNAPFWRRWFG
jgi:serine/threonine protein kinase